MNTFQTGRLGREIQVGGKAYLHFSGTAYLGIGNQTTFERRLIDGIKRYGASHGSSRDSTVQLGIFDEFESYFAQLAGAGSALCVSSGYLAGRLALKYLEGRYDQLWVAPGTHPAILPKATVTPPKLSFNQWANSCLARSRSLMGQRILILSNAVNPILPEIHSFDWIDQLHTQNQYGLLLDDSHAFGTLDTGMYGTFHTWKHVKASLMICGSLAKAFGLPGGIILSDEEGRQGLRKLSMYRGASPPAPAFLHAFTNCQEIYSEQWKKLLINTQWIYEQTKNIPEVTAIPNFPVLSLKPVSWVNALEKEGIIVSSFPYPRPQDPSVTRVVISAEHTVDDLKALVNALRSLSKK